MRDLSEVIDIKMRMDRARAFQTEYKKEKDACPYSIEYIMKFIEEWESMQQLFRRKRK